MNKITSSILAIVILGSVFYFVQSNTGASNGVNTSGKKNISTQSVENSVVKDGVQYINVKAQGGYSPRQSFAKAGIPTKLIMTTDGTYDCSASLVIPSLGYRKMLPNTGETSIDLGTPKTGDVLNGICGMGMYSFAITFQ